MTGVGFSVTVTPDDGTRLSDHRLWDETERPTGPDRDPVVHLCYEERELVKPLTRLGVLG